MRGSKELRYAPFLVVVGDIERVGAWPGAARQAVGTSGGRGVSAHPSSLARYGPGSKPFAVLVTLPATGAAGATPSQLLLEGLVESRLDPSCPEVQAVCRQAGGCYRRILPVPARSGGGRLTDRILAVRSR